MPSDHLGAERQLIAVYPEEEGSMLATKALDGMIVNQPKTHNGRPVLAGTGTTVRSIAIMYKQGYSSEEITAELPVDLEPCPNDRESGGE